LGYVKIEGLKKIYFYGFSGTLNLVILGMYYCAAAVMKGNGGSTLMGSCFKFHATQKGKGKGTGFKSARCSADCTIYPRLYGVTQ
jgi:hypothetical protein